jgi:hypothetical protein
MGPKTVTLALRLTDEKTKKIHCVIKKSIGLTTDEEAEENVRPFSDFINGLTSEVNKICEQQGLQLSDAESIEQKLLISILLSLAKEELNDFSIDIPVLETTKPKETKEEEK